MKNKGIIAPGLKAICGLRVVHKSVTCSVTSTVTIIRSLFVLVYFTILIVVSPIFLTAHRDAEAPRFLDRMQNLQVREGDPVVLSASATGVPTPMMSWQKDGRMIPTNDQNYKVHKTSLAV